MFFETDKSKTIQLFWYIQYPFCVTIKMRIWSFLVSSPWFLLPGHQGSYVHSRLLTRLFRHKKSFLFFSSLLFQALLLASLLAYCLMDSLSEPSLLEGRITVLWKISDSSVTLSLSPSFQGLCFDVSQSKRICFRWPSLRMKKGKQQWRQNPNTDIVRLLEMSAWLAIMRPLERSAVAWPVSLPPQP